VKDGTGFGPVFVGGHSRAGKTLVRWALSAHSRMAVSRRSDLWPRFFGRYGDLSCPDNLTRCLDAMRARQQVASMQLDFAALRVRLPAGTSGYARLFALAHEQFAARHGKARWGDQTESIGKFAGIIVPAYPGARIIHMVRDPRDVLAALTAPSGTRMTWLARATAAWCAAVDVALRNEERYPGACCIVRYESLVTAPEPTLRGLCDFLGECYEPAMARLEGAGRYDAARAVAPGGVPISAEYVGQYRDRLASSEVAYVQRCAAGRMAALGYQPDTVDLSPAGRLRYAATLPLSHPAGAYARARPRTGGWRTA
jgi:hypothetical protein